MKSNKNYHEKFKICTKLNKSQPIMDKNIYITLRLKFMLIKLLLDLVFIID